MRFERLRFGVGRLGLVARVVYVLWALLCLALYWLWMEGLELGQGWDREDVPATVDEAQARYQKSFEEWEAANPCLKPKWGKLPENCTDPRPRPETVRKPDPIDLYGYVPIDRKKSAETIKEGVCVAEAGYKLICPQRYLDARLSELIGEQGEAREALRWRFLILFTGGLVLFYPLMWGIAAVLESETYQKLLKHGTGGSARWGGVLAFRKYGWNRIQRGPKAPLYMGRTLHKYDPWPLCRSIGIDDINHLVTIAQSGSGKSTTAIWPNLVKHPYPDSVFVLDPKGEHALLTGKRRAARGDRVYVLDPFNETKGQVERHCFNPLAEIDARSPRAKEDIGAIADACVIPQASKSGTDDHFEKLQKAMITGLIAHVMTTEPKENHTLPQVYEYFLALADEEAFLAFLDKMSQNSACGNAPKEAVLMYQKAGKNEKGSIFTTTVSNISWIASEGMHEHLSRSDFSLSELRTERTSLYVVLDFKVMTPERQGRYMRMLTNLAFETCRNVPLPEDRKRQGRRTLFILDEVAQLGPMPSIANAYQTLRGYDVKIWTFFQNYGAVEANYKSPDDLLGNASKQFFGCNSPQTAREIESYLGQWLHKRGTGTGDGSGTYESKKPLLSHDEIMNTLGQTSPAQIVITAADVKYKMELKRETYIPGDEVVASEEMQDDNLIKTIIREIRIYLRIRDKKETIARTSELLRTARNDLSSLSDIGRDFNELKRRASFHGLSAKDATRMLAQYEQVLQAGYVMRKFKRVVEDAHVKEHLAEFADLPKHCHLHHAGEVNSIFRYAAELIPTGEILELADYIASNEVLRQSAFIDFGRCYLSDDIFIGMHALVKRCPVWNKVAFYAKLDSSGYLKNRLQKQKNSSIAYFVADAFDGVETNTAVAVLRASPSWREVKKDQSLRDWIIDRDERLLPALEEAQAEPEPDEGEEDDFVRAAGHKEDPKYTQEQKDAMARFWLAEGFTKEELNERYAERLDKAPASQIEQVNADYEILLPVAA